MDAHVCEESVKDREWLAERPETEDILLVDGPFGTIWVCGLEEDRQSPADVEPRLYDSPRTEEPEGFKVCATRRQAGPSAREQSLL